MNPMSTLSPSQKLAAARLSAARRFPYFTSALLSLSPRLAPGLGTMAVTHRAVLLWDEKALEGWSVNQIAAVLVHEIGHLLRGHHGRCAAMGADPKLFNLAGDAEINDDIVAMGLDLPGDPVLPKHFDKEDGLTAEEYYHAAVQKGAQGPAGPQAGGGWCGSAGGQAVPGEPADDDKGGRSAADLARIQQETAEAVRSHEAKNGQGSVPAGWSRWAEGALAAPKIPWQAKLARCTRAAVAYRPGAIDYRYSRMSRRQGGVGFGPGKPVLPAMIAPVPQVMVAVDTSGSMGDQEMQRALSETASILAAVGAEVDFVSCDAQVHSDRKIRHWKEIAALLKGGGGTDFRPVFDAAMRKRPRPEVLVFVTDGCGPAPSRPPPGVKVIWLLVGPYRQKPQGFQSNGEDDHAHTGEVNWGEFIEIDDDGRAESADA
jgi:predicted metal-dependent peptidase